MKTSIIITYLGKINQMHSKKFKRNKRRKGKDKKNKKMNICLIYFSDKYSKF